VPAPSERAAAPSRQASQPRAQRPSFAPSRWRGSATRSGCPSPRSLRATPQTPASSPRRRAARESSSSHWLVTEPASLDMDAIGGGATSQIKITRSARPCSARAGRRSRRSFDPSGVRGGGRSHLLGGQRGGEIVCEELAGRANPRKSARSAEREEIAKAAVTIANPHDRRNAARGVRAAQRLRYAIGVRGRHCDHPPCRGGGSAGTASHRRDRVPRRRLPVVAAGMAVPH
jgi:hypothetical protein